MPNFVLYNLCTAPNQALFRNLRNRVNRVCKSLKKQYYLDKIEQLKTGNPSHWWKNIKLLCHMQTKSAENCFDNIMYNAQTVEVQCLPDVINNFLVDVTCDIPALDVTTLNKLRMNLGPLPDEYVVDVCNKLFKVKLNKAVGPDGISNKLLKHLPDVLGPPLTAIINCSLRQGAVPDVWKLSRVTPIPKTFPACNVENDIRPIAVTNVVAKIAESFVSKHFNSSFDEITDSNQFGCVRNRSTTQALLKFMHELFKASDSTANIIRILFVDFSKAFDLIDHNVLMHKFISNGLPSHIISWSMDFVLHRKQYVQVGGNCSSILTTHAGTPQGTLAGPNNFKLLINDLTFDQEYIKYVDDTTVLSVSTNPQDSSLQAAADHLVEWTQCNSMVVNEQKTKEMLIYFGTKVDPTTIQKIRINDKDIERIKTFKLLGVIISNDLSWDAHVDYILGKVAKRFYFLIQLVHAGVRDSDMITIFCSIVHSVLEYACPVT
jgi:hypothetical protein